MSIEEHMEGIRRKAWWKKQKIRRRFFVLNRRGEHNVRVVVQWDPPSGLFAAHWAITTLKKNRRWAGSDSRGSGYGPTPKMAVKEIRVAVSKALHPQVQAVTDRILKKGSSNPYWTSNYPDRNDDEP